MLRRLDTRAGASAGKPALHAFSRRCDPKNVACVQIETDVAGPRTSFKDLSWDSKAKGASSPGYAGGRVGCEATDAIAAFRRTSPTARAAKVTSTSRQGLAADGIRC